MKNWVRIFVAGVAVLTLALAVAGKAFAEDKAPAPAAEAKPAAPNAALNKDEKIELTLSIKDHKFDPETIEAPANRKVSIVIKNEDNAIEEFESISLHREKVIPAKGTITINVGPLSEGEYEFVGEFHKDTARGKLLVK